MMAIAHPRVKADSELMVIKVRVLHLLESILDLQPTQAKQPGMLRSAVSPTEFRQMTTDMVSFIQQNTDAHATR
jgi:hypothetical protein